MSHAVDALLGNLAAGGPRRCIFEHGRWLGAADLASAVQRWRGEIARRVPHEGAVLGLQATFCLDAIACLLAAWAERCIVALVPPGADADTAGCDAHAELLLCLGRRGEARWIAREERREEPLLRSLRQSRDAGVVLFTSGSEGRPRAAVHAVSRLLGKFGDGRALRTLAVLQMDHIAGLDALLYTLCAGGAFVIARGRTPEEVCEAIAAARVQVLSTSPSFLRLLCRGVDARQVDLSSVEVVTYGSEPMDPATLARVNALFPRARISQKYGTTELGAPRTASEANDSLWVRMGADVEVDVRDGVLWVRSPHQFLGYLGAPAPFDARGWYCTGDRVERRGEWLRILGRAGEIISVGGEKVSPSQVEAVILELDDVLAAVVRGEPNPLLGEVAVACVSLREGASPEDATRLIRRHCRARLPRYQVPVRVDVVEGLVGERQKLRRR